MAKNFHYFKFIATEWLTGDIFFEDYELQGIFISACAIYWQRDGKLSLEDLKKRIKSERLSELTDRFIYVNNGNVLIKFLDEQLREAFHISVQNSENGKKGGRPKAASTLQKKPTAFFSESETEAKKSQIEIKENKIELDNTGKPINSDEFLKIIESNEDDYVWMEWLIKKFNFKDSYEANQEVNFAYRKFIREKYLDKGEQIYFEDVKHVRNSASKWYEGVIKKQEAEAKRKMVW